MYRVQVQNYKRELNETYARELSDCGYEVVEDTGDGAMKTFLNCLVCGDGDMLYLEDDAILCKDFIKKVDKELDELGRDKIVQFFSLKKSVDKTTLMGGGTYCGNVCLFIPNKIRLGILKFYEEWKNSKVGVENPTAMDYLVRDYLKKTKQKYYLVVPNLVQHQVGKSVIDPRRSSKRQSLYYIEDKEV